MIDDDVVPEMIDDEPLAADGLPMVPTLDRLKAEVARCERRLEAAREDLRRYMLSHGESAGEVRACGENSARVGVRRG